MTTTKMVKGKTYYLYDDELLLATITNGEIVIPAEIEIYVEEEPR